MATPIDMLINAAVLHCACCNAPATFNEYLGRHVSECPCHHGYVDSCQQTGRCALHCVCPVCTKTRGAGLWRVNWTGIYHLYLAGDSRTRCGRQLPKDAPHIVRAPALRWNRRDCDRCTRSRKYTPPALAARGKT